MGNMSLPPQAALRPPGDLLHRRFRVLSLRVSAPAGGGGRRVPRGNVRRGQQRAALRGRLGHRARRLHRVRRGGSAALLAAQPLALLPALPGDPARPGRPPGAGPRPGRARAAGGDSFAGEVRRRGPRGRRLRARNARDLPRHAGIRRDPGPRTAGNPISVPEARAGTIPAPSSPRPRLPGAPNRKDTPRRPSSRARCPRSGRRCCPTSGRGRQRRQAGRCRARS